MFFSSFFLLLYHRETEVVSVTADLSSITWRSGGTPATEHAALQSAPLMTTNEHMHSPLNENGRGEECCMLEGGKGVCWRVVKVYVFLKLRFSALKQNHFELFKYLKCTPCRALREM